MSLLEFTEEIATWNTSEWQVHHCKICKLFKTPSMFFMSNHAKRHERGLQFFNCEIGNVEIYSCKDCDFRTGIAITLKKHILQNHIAQTELKIQKFNGSQNYVCRNCDFQTEFILVWFKHLTEVCNYNAEIQEEEGVNQHPTGGETTLYNKTKLMRRLRKHKIDKHWYNCDKCEYRAKSKSNLTSHKICRHLEDHEIQWHTCGKCEFKTKIKRTLSQHNMYKHLEDHVIKWHTCDTCEFKTKHKSSLRKHKIVKHLQDHEIQWHRCDRCEFRTKINWNLKQHKKYLHLEDH